MIPQYSALQAALIIGVVWALWYAIPFALLGRSAKWIVWPGAGMVCLRIIIVWMVMNARRSTLIAVLFHMMSNSVWGVFTNFDPYYNPMVMSAVLRYSPRKVRGCTSRIFSARCMGRFR